MLNIEARREAEAARLRPGEALSGAGAREREMTLEAAAPFLRERIPWSAVHQAFVGARRP